jgi:dienelactone hydrolase
MLRIILLTILTGGVNLAMAEIQTEEVSYSGGGVEMRGYLAWDPAIEGQRPGVIVVHEWWGHNAYPRKRAEMLAELGYTALAVDMYGDQRVADHPDSAGAFMTEVLKNMEAGRARFEAGLELLKAHPTVNPEKTAAVGYCFGGGVVLHMARMGADLDAVASFHGSLGMANAPGVEKMAARVVAYNGEADPFVSAEQIQGFVDEMEGAGADYQFVQLPGAVHGFSNPAATSNGEKFGLPLKYNALADEASWAHMQLLFQDVFKD